jgi:hypothetical protein
MKYPLEKDFHPKLHFEVLLESPEHAELTGEE